MMIRLVIEPEAVKELEEAAEHYEDAVPALGPAFLAEMRQRTRDVVSAPLSFPRFGGVEGVRCAYAIGRFPQLVVYMLVADTVHVLAYMHPRQRPEYWAHRVPLR